MSELQRRKAEGTGGKSRPELAQAIRDTTCALESLVPRQAGRTRHSKRGGLVILDVPELSATRQAGVICRRGGWLSPAAAEILQELRTICADDPHN
jgi:hypothetical protein